MDSISTKEMKVLDANSEWFGTPAIELMENAGRGVAREANKLGDSFVIICGPGNNGGDGFASARYLKSRPEIFYFWMPKTAEAHENFLKAKNYRPVQITDEKLPELEKAITGSDVIIDAIFGTGIKGKLREPVRSVVEMVNQSKKRVLSIDVPSGMDPDSGKTPDISVMADLTVAPHAPKGRVAKRKSSGRVVVVDIGIHPKSYTHVGRGDFKFNYPKRKAGAHKGDAGRVLVVGGSENYTGAPYFAAMAALKAGCDLSYVAAPRKASERLASMAPDLIVYPLKSEQTLSGQDVGAIPSNADALCIGNGLGDDKKSLEAALDIISNASRAKMPMVIDGDGLKAVKPILPRLGGNTILLPHRGEFRRLFGMAANEKNAGKMAGKYKCAIVLKGQVDIIVQGKRAKYSESGNPYMSKGGTGDVLAGLCAGFLAQGVEPFQAACFGALLNGVAGDLAYTENSIAMTASDVLDSVGLAELLLLS